MVRPALHIGKLIGGFCALFGVFILSLPIPIVVSSFASCYKNRLWRTEVDAKKAEKMREKTISQQKLDNFLEPWRVKVEPETNETTPALYT